MHVVTYLRREKKYQTSLIKYLDSSEETTKVTDDLIDEAKSSANAVLEPGLTYLERLNKIVQQKFQGAKKSVAQNINKEVAKYSKRYLIYQ